MIKDRISADDSVTIIIKHGGDENEDSDKKESSE